MNIFSKITFLSCILSGSFLSQQIVACEDQAVIRLIDGTRKLEILKNQGKRVDDIFKFIDSCTSSTPLSGGAGAGPLSAITEFRDLVATQPSTIISLAKVREAKDKSGIKGEPALKIKELMIINLVKQPNRIFAYTDEGLLIEFSHGNKDLLATLSTIFKTQKMQNKTQ